MHKLYIRDVKQKLISIDFWIFFRQLIGPTVQPQRSPVILNNFPPEKTLNVFYLLFFKDEKDLSLVPFYK